jgi:hypothetical protein
MSQKQGGREAAGRSGEGTTALNRSAEQIRNEFPKVTSLILNMKKIFCKAPSRIAAFKEKLPTTLLPLQPVLTH